MKNFIKKNFKNVVKLIYRILTKICKVQKDMIVFESNLGRNYTGNPRYIYEEMVRQGLDKEYKCYFILNDLSTQIPGNVKKIKRVRMQYFYIMAVSGIWVCDSRLPRYIIKRKENHYIQTWHGTPLKKLALDMDDVAMAGEATIDTYKKNFFNNAQTWDYLISQNLFSSEIFKSAFGFQKTMLEVGYPRNDTLINDNNEEYILKLKQKLKLPLDKKIILYAPTWRDDEFYGKGKYKFSPKLAFNMVRKKLEKDYVMIVKYHYLIMDDIDWSGFEGFIYDYDLSYDIAELYLVSDMLITDYSSVMFDYSLLRRPMFFYAYDLENYKNNLRGFYFDFIHEAPGPVSLSTEDLIDDIINFNSEEHKEKYRAFSRKYNHVDNGTASKQIISLIQSWKK